MDEPESKDWKLNLRYGRIKTEFRHYALIADGLVEDPNPDFESSIGPAVMGIKVGALDDEEAFDMCRNIGAQLGFNVTGKIELYETEPDQPPKENPYGYGINFTSYDGNA